MGGQNGASSGSEIDEDPAQGSPAKDLAVIVGTIVTTASGSQVQTIPVFSILCLPTAGIGAVINSQFGGDPNGLATAEQAAGTILTVGGQTATLINPSAVTIGGAIVLAGEPGQVIGG